MSAESDVKAWNSLVWTGAGIAAMGYLLPMLMQRWKDKSMTAMEKAAFTLLQLVLGKLEEQDKDLTELRKRPTDKEYDAACKERDSYAGKLAAADATLRDRDDLVKSLQKEIQHANDAIAELRGKKRSKR